MLHKKLGDHSICYPTHRSVAENAAKQDVYNWTITSQRWFLNSSAICGHCDTCLFLNSLVRIMLQALGIVRSRLTVKVSCWFCIKKKLPAFSNLSQISAPKTQRRQLRRAEGGTDTGKLCWRENVSIFIYTISPVASIFSQESASKEDVKSEATLP